MKGQHSGNGVAQLEKQHLLVAEGHSPKVVVWNGHQPSGAVEVGRQNEDMWNGNRNSNLQSFQLTSQYGGYAVLTMEIIKPGGIVVN